MVKNHAVQLGTAPLHTITSHVHARHQMPPLFPPTVNILNGPVTLRSDANRPRRGSLKMMTASGDLVPQSLAAVMGPT